MTVTQARAGEQCGAEAARAALDRAARHLLDQQHVLRLVAGRAGDQRHDGRRGPAAARVPRHPDAAGDAAAARWIRSKQRADGTWANYYEGDADLSTTVEAYVALRLAGDSPDASHMAMAAGWIRAAGGIPATRVFTRIWLALFGEWSWDELPVMPPEMIYLPGWFPLNVHDWACWARQTIVPLTVVGSLRPVRPLPFGLPELRPAGGRRPRRPAAGRAARPGWPAFFGGLDRVLHSSTSGTARRKGRCARSGPRPCGAARSGSSPGRSRRLLGRDSAALGVLADRAAPARLRPGASRA
jgi:hypothetical protein